MRQAARSILIVAGGAGLFAIGLAVGHVRPAQSPDKVSLQSFRPASQIAIHRQTTVLLDDGTRDDDWHALQVLGVGKRKPADHPPGLVWSMSLEDGSIVWLLEANP